MYMQTWIEKPASNSSQPPPVVVYLRKSFTKIFAMLRLAYTFTKSTTFAGSRTNRPHYLKTPNPIPTNCTVLDHDTAFTCTVAILKPCLQQSRTTTHTVFTRSDATATIYLVHQFCAASIRERRLFESGAFLLSQSLRWCWREQRLCCFEFASLVHDEFSRVHMLLKYSSRPLRLLFESGVYFVQHAWRCGSCLRAATNREQRLIERIQEHHQHLYMYILLNHVLTVHTCMHCIWTA